MVVVLVVFVGGGGGSSGSSSVGESAIGKAVTCFGLHG